MGPAQEQGRHRRGGHQPPASEMPPPYSHEDDDDRGSGKAPSASTIRRASREKDRSMPPPDDRPSAHRSTSSASAMEARRGRQTSSGRPTSQRLAERGGENSRRHREQQQQHPAFSTEDDALYQESEEDEDDDSGEAHESLTNAGHPHQRMELAEIDAYEEGMSEEETKSSPARSSAALALASMFRQNPSATEPVGYAFPLSDTPQRTTGGGRQKGKRGATGGGQRRNAASSLKATDDATTGRAQAESTRPRKKDRKSAPFSSPSSQAMATVWRDKPRVVAGSSGAFGVRPDDSAISMMPPASLDFSSGPGPVSGMPPMGGHAPDNGAGDSVSGGASSNGHMALPPSGSATTLGKALGNEIMGNGGTGLGAGGQGAATGEAGGSREAAENEAGSTHHMAGPAPVQEYPPSHGMPPYCEDYQHMQMMDVHQPPPLPPLAYGAMGAMYPVPPTRSVNDSQSQFAVAAYNRKEKSLGLLCENFMKRFGEHPPDQGISLDRAAHVLGVERRRIYDIINILESVCYVSRRCKNTYIWHGHSYLSSTLKQLQDEALELWPVDARRNGLALPKNHVPRGAAGAKSGVNWPIKVPGLSEPGQATLDDRKEKSLGRLSQKFIQLFLVGYQVISLAGAAEKLLGPSMDTMTDKGMKTKVRRLYDIANVLTSLRLIDKVIVPESRKPSFRWVGIPAVLLLHQPAPLGPAPANTGTSSSTGGGNGSSSSSGTGAGSSSGSGQVIGHEESPSSGMTTGTESTTTSPHFGNAEHLQGVRTSLAMAMHEQDAEGAEQAGAPPAAQAQYPQQAANANTAGFGTGNGKMPKQPDDWQHWDGSAPSDNDPRMQPHHAYYLPDPGMGYMGRGHMPPPAAALLPTIKPPNPMGWTGEGGYLGAGSDMEQHSTSLEAGLGMREQEGPTDGAGTNEPSKRRKGANSHPSQTVQL